MRVLMINVVCGIRSTGRICTDLAKVLEAQGHEVRIAYGRGCVPDQFQKYAVRVGSDLDVMLHGVKARLIDAAGFGSTYATKRFIKWVRDYDPDIIHLHNIHGYYINVEILFNYLSESKKPVVWTLHDCWAFTGHCTHFTYTRCEKWKTGCYNCPQKSRYPASYISDRSKHNWEHKKILFTDIDKMTLVTPSRWLAGLVQESFINMYPVEVIPNGIDTNVFRHTQSDFRARHGAENERIVLGVASVWDERKGLSDFIRLSTMLDSNYRIVLVGLSKKQLRNLPQNIIGIARTNNTKEIAEIYSAANVFVNPTYEDNYPTTNLESMACGTPVITYKTGGSPEIIEKCGGRIVDRGNLDGIIKAIQDIISNPIKMDFRSEENDCGFVIESYLNLYKSSESSGSI